VGRPRTWGCRGRGEGLELFYLLYREAADRIGIKRTATKLLPGVGITEHALEDGRTVCVAVNYEPEEAVCPVAVNGKVVQTWNGEWSSGTLRIAGNDAAVFLVE